MSYKIKEVIIEIKRTYIVEYHIDGMVTPRVCYELEDGRTVMSSESVTTPLF